MILHDSILLYMLFAAMIYSIWSNEGRGELLYIYTGNHVYSVKEREVSFMITFSRCHINNEK